MEIVFLRPIRLFVSGTEDNHEIILDFLLQHMFENRHTTVRPFLINYLDINVEQQRLQTWASETEILFKTRLLKTDICVFSNTVNDWQVHSGEILQPELQISPLRLLLTRKRKTILK